MALDVDATGDRPPSSSAVTAPATTVRLRTGSAVRPDSHPSLRSICPPGHRRFGEPNVAGRRRWAGISPRKDVDIGT